MTEADSGRRLNKAIDVGFLFVFFLFSEVDEEASAPAALSSMLVLPGSLRARPQLSPHYPQRQRPSVTALEGPRPSPGCDLPESPRCLRWKAFRKQTVSQPPPACKERYFQLDWRVRSLVSAAQTLRSKPGAPLVAQESSQRNLRRPGISTCILGASLGSISRVLQLAWTLTVCSKRDASFPWCSMAREAPGTQPCSRGMLN